MLKIEHHHTEFHLPHFEMSRMMHLSPVVADNDELSQAIANDPIDHDNNWQLTERPDESELRHAMRTWDTIIDEVRQDPEWFADDEAA